MTKNNPNRLRIAPDKFRLADIVLAIVFVVVTIIATYYAVVEGVRDFWLLVIVGIIGAILMGQRVISGKSEL